MTVQKDMLWLAFVCLPFFLSAQLWEKNYDTDTWNAVDLREEGNGDLIFTGHFGTTTSDWEHFAINAVGDSLYTTPYTPRLSGQNFIDDNDGFWYSEDKLITRTDATGNVLWTVSLDSMGFADALFAGSFSPRLGGAVLFAEYQSELHMINIDEMGQVENSWALPTIFIVRGRPLAINGSTFFLSDGPGSYGDATFLNKVDATGMVTQREFFPFTSNTSVLKFQAAPDGDLVVMMNRYPDLLPHRNTITLKKISATNLQDVWSQELFKNQNSDNIEAHTGDLMVQGNLVNTVYIYADDADFDNAGERASFQEIRLQAFDVYTGALVDGITHYNMDQRYQPVQIDALANGDLVLSGRKEDTATEYKNSFVLLVSGFIVANRDFENLVEVTVQPNPSSGLFHLEVSLDEKQKIEIGVFDLQGRLVQAIHQGEILDIESQIDLSKEANGLYFVQIKHNKGVYTQKLVKMD